MIVITYPLFFGLDGQLGFRCRAVLVQWFFGPCILFVASPTTYVCIACSTSSKSLVLGLLRTTDWIVVLESVGSIV